MAVDRAWLEELPPIPAQTQWRNPTRAEFFNAFRERGDELRARSLYWSLRIGEETGQWADLVNPLPGYQWAQVGFVADTEDALPFDPGEERFGLLACCDDPEAEPRLLEGHIEVDGEAFPIAVLTAWFEPHVQVTGPRRGCVAGWARSRLSTQARSGWLTAGHVAPSNQTIRLSDGGIGTVIDRAPPCVDAAMVSTDRPPGGRIRAAIAASLVAGDAVRMHDQHGCVLPMTVRTVDPTLGVTVTRYLPVRFSMDRHGQHGDSGALIDEQGTKEVAGIYLGRYVDYRGSGAALGIGLSAHYLAALMDMEILL